MTKELYRRYRPKTLEELVGQDEAVKTLKAMSAKKEIPHCLLLVGGSGVGKTTIARILRKELGCHQADFMEVNCAQDAGIDKVKDIQRMSTRAPMAGTCRVFYWDECQALARTSFAQQAALKMLEDIPDHVWHILATTDPTKLHKAVLTRCVRLDLKQIKPDALKSLMKVVCKAEKIEAGDDLLGRIAEVADGSARDALQILERVSRLPEKERLEAVVKSGVKKQAFDLVRLMVWQKGAKWEDARKILVDIEGTEPEQFRQLVRACAKKEMAKEGGNAARGFLVLEAFGKMFYDEADIYRAVYEVLCG